MSSEHNVAKRYAKALFEVAKEQNIITAAENDLLLVAGVLKDLPEFAKLLEHPNVSSEAKTDLLTKAFEGKISVPVWNTLQLMVAKGRGGLFVQLLEQFVEIANEASGKVTAVAYTPELLTEAESQAVADTFSAITGKTVTLRNEVDPSLLGGIRVRIGDRLYDGSLSGKLDRLKKELNVSQAI